MIEAKDLRIGNWLFDPDRELLSGTNEAFVQVSAFSSETEGMIHHVRDTGFGIGHSGNYADRLEPIPLTPEILEKCGFINNNGAWWTLNLPLPEGFTYPDGYWNFSYCKGVLFINSYSGSGFSLEDAVEIMKEENKKGHNVKASSFDLNIENKVLPPNMYKYLHQLQNLYYALTNEELQIKL